MNNLRGDKNKVEKCLICQNTMKSLFEFPEGNNVYKCRKCGLRSLRPLPTKVILKDFYNRNEYYKEEIAELHDDLVIGYDDNLPIIRLYKKHIQKIISYQSPPGKLLEVGCARGVFLDLARKSQYQVTGIEMNDYAVTYAQEKFNLPVCKMSLEETDFKPESFEIVVSYDVIEHLTTPQLLIEKASVFLKANGLLVISTPNSNSLINHLSEQLAILTHNSYYYPAYRFYGRGIEHLNIFNPQNLVILLKKNNFEVLHKYSYNIPLSNICDANLIYKSVLWILMKHPYEFVIIARKSAR